MPTAPPRCCPCGGLIRDSTCDRCGPKKREARKRHDQQRGSSTERGYDYRWQQFCEVYRKLNPMCHDCLAKDIVTSTTDVHHIKKLRDYPELKYEETNLMPLCSDCHDDRTQRGE